MPRYNLRLTKLLIQMHFHSIEPPMVEIRANLKGTSYGDFYRPSGASQRYKDPRVFRASSAPSNDALIASAASNAFFALAFSPVKA